MTNTLFGIVFCFSSSICAVVSIIAWQRGKVRGARFLALSMLSVSVWAAASAMEQFSPGMAGKIFWSKIQYLGITTLPPFWLLFSLDYTQLDKWSPHKVKIALWIIPLLTLAAAFTNEYHHQLWTTITPLTSDPASALRYGHGPIFWMISIYSYLLLLVAALALIWVLIAFPSLYQRQALALLTGLFLPWLLNIGYTYADIAPGIDITPLGFAVSGLIYAFTVFRFQLFDVAPIARHTLVDSLSDSVLVLDRYNHIADVNRIALTWIGLPLSDIIGKPADEALNCWPELVQKYKNVYETTDELTLRKKDGTALECELQISSIRDSGGETSGRVIVLRDITGRKVIEDQNTQQRLELLIVNQLSQAVASQLELTKLIKLVGEQISKIFAVDGVFIALYDLPNQIITFPYWQTYGIIYEEPPMPHGQGLTSHVLQTRRPLLILNDDQEEFAKLGAIPSASDDSNETTKSWMGVPIMVGSQPTGVLAAFSYTHENAFSEADLHLMTTLAANVSIAIENAKLYEKARAEIKLRTKAERSLREANTLLQAQLEKVEALQVELREQAIRDPLTGLFNRRYMEETLQRELAHAEREKTPVSILIMDIDKFKNVNDAYGHKTGDNMLKALSTLLMHNIRGSDVVCRYGGEEFVVIFNGTSHENALKRAEKLRKDFQALSVEHEGQPVSATISIGVATYPVHASTGEGVLIKADQALYVAKQTGRNKVIASK